MSLTRQIMMIFIGTLLLLFLGTFIITVYQAKGYFEGQLNNNAQDSATALALTISKSYEEGSGKAMILANVKAAFDRGYFSKIAVTDTKGNVIVKRYTKFKPQIAPKWFRSLIPFDHKAKSALISSGWKQKGKVVVKSNTSLAYLSLWHATLYLFFLFLILTIALILLGGLFIHSFLKPLKFIIQQAQDIGKKQLYLLTIKPRTKELRNLSMTINDMVEKLQNIFNEQLKETEALRRKAYVDKLTGLGNRRYFFQQLGNFLNTEQIYDAGYLVLVELDGLISYNKKHGYHGGDQLLKAVSNILKDSLDKQNTRILSRLEGPSFSFILLDENANPPKKSLSSLHKNLHDFLTTIDKNLTCHISAARYQFDMKASALMTKADELIQHSKANKQSSVCIQEPNALEKESELQYSEQNIKKAIDNKNFKIYKQPVKSETELFHNEVYIKLLTPAGEISAYIFLPVAKRIGYDYKIDEYMLKRIIKQVENDQVIAINIGESLIYDNIRQDAFIKLIDSHKELHQNIHFEISEIFFSVNRKHSLEFISKLGKRGFKVGLDHVGASLASFDHFRDSNISYLKLDSTLCTNLEKSDYKRQIIKNLVALCENIQIALIATQIESESQWSSLQKLGVIWFQGNYFEKPTDL